jgi:hypothetical protein
MFLRQQQLREAAASVSLSHAEDCPCLVCRGAQGDEDALAELLLSLEDVIE